MIKYINNLIMLEAAKLKYSVSDNAPSTFKDLVNTSSLVVWNGGSDKTIFNDPNVNYAFRAIHDALHIKHNIDFTIQGEIDLARIHANMQSSQLMADLIYIEVAEQAIELAKTGQFVDNQIEFTLNKLKQLGYKIAA